MKVYRSQKGMIVFDFTALFCLARIYFDQIILGLKQGIFLHCSYNFRALNILYHRQYRLIHCQ